jgi:hypothetical protein
MQYATFPMPEDSPAYLSHAALAAYFDEFVDHFGFRRYIQFRTEVTSVLPTGEGWDVTVRHRDTGTERTGRYGAVLVANGHHWDPRYPQPGFPGTFAGEHLHSHDYRTPERFEGRRVLVLGIGNSACDIASDCSRTAARTVLAVRRGAHIVPKHLFGRPTDHLTFLRLGARAPMWAQRAAVGLLLRLAQGPVTRYGLPAPDHRLLSAPPTVSDSLLSRLAHGDITVRPGIAAFEGGSVRFTDGSAEPFDAVIYCTGYRVSFPFLDEALLGAADGDIPLYRRVVPPALPGLYFIGLVQPIGATMPVAEVQSEWVADLLQGRAALPPQPRMLREVARYRAATARRYPASSGPLIQVGFQSYLRQIRRERSHHPHPPPHGGGKVRQAAGRCRPVPWPSWPSRAGRFPAGG